MTIKECYPERVNMKEYLPWKCNYEGMLPWKSYYEEVLHWKCYYEEVLHWKSYYEEVICTLKGTTMLIQSSPGPEAGLSLINQSINSLINQPINTYVKLLILNRRSITKSITDSLSKFNKYRSYMNIKSKILLKWVNSIHIYSIIHS